MDVRKGKNKHCRVSLQQTEILIKFSYDRFCRNVLITTTTTPPPHQAVSHPWWQQPQDCRREEESEILQKIRACFIDTVWRMSESQDSSDSVHCSLGLWKWIMFDKRKYYTYFHRVCVLFFRKVLSFQISSFFSECPSHQSTFFLRRRTDDKIFRETGFELMVLFWYFLPHFSLVCGCDDNWTVVKYTIIWCPFVRRYFPCGTVVANSSPDFIFWNEYS